MVVVKRKSVSCRGKLRNPATRRCVKRSGSVAKRMKSCRTKLVNPKTGRCVKRSGALGRKLLGKAPLKRRKKRTARK